MSNEYWESRFKNEGFMWDFYPSDSAFAALKLFQSLNIQKILIPGVGYGRNARIFAENGFDITGIEISSSAINLARKNGLNFTIHCGSVTDMPFDDEVYDGIFCYALIHLLKKSDRKRFLRACYAQLKPGAIMVFTLATTAMSMFGTGRKLSKNRFEITPGLKVFFYDEKAVEMEFSDFGLIESRDILEPIKYLENQQPIVLKYVVCRKK